MKAPGGAPLVAVLGAAVVISLTTGTAAAVRRSATPAATLTAAPVDLAHAAPADLAVGSAAATGPDVSYDVTPTPNPASRTVISAGAAARSVPDLRVTLKLRQTTVAVGDLVEADLGVDDSDGVPAEYVLDWGDGRAQPNAPAARCGQATIVAGHQPRPTHWTNRVEYSYRAPGRYSVVYRMRTHGGCGTTDAPEEQAARAVITVLKGPLPTNGGRRPQAFLSMSNRGTSPGGIVVDVQGQDLDGWVTQMIVDFGDGTPARMVENPARCVAGRGEWPSTPYFFHRYDAPYQVVGRYTATLTVFTAGCDGKSVQQTTVRQQVVVPQPV